MKIWALALAVGLILTAFDSEAARRIGGGKSMGKQSSNVTQREAANPAPAAPGAPTQNANSAAAKPAPAAAPSPAAQPAKRPWGAMLGGLAAGLGLAWLASSLGLGEAFGNILMFGLLALGAVMLLGWFMRKRATAATQQHAPFAFQGAGASGGAFGGSAAPVEKPKQYRAENVGNDASARPWERANTAFDSTAGGSASMGSSATGSMIGSALGGSQAWGVPADFDTEGFLKSAKTNFITLQAAWDRSDVPALRAMMTDEMIQEIQSQLAERETHAGSGPNLTDVVMIEARLLGIEELADVYMASVEFSGMIREDLSAGPNPFREVWNMTKAKNGSSGWLVAGVQALQ